MMKSFMQYNEKWFNRKGSSTFHFTNNVKRKLANGKETQIQSANCNGQSKVNSKDGMIVLEQLGPKEIGTQLQSISRQLQQLFSRFDRMEANFQVMELKIQDIASEQNALA